MQKDIKEQFDRGRLKLSSWEKISHYWFIGPILVMSWFAWYPEIFDHAVATAFPIGTLLIFALILFFIYRQYSVLKFKQYAIKHTATHFQEAAKATAMELDWHIEVLDESLLRAKRNDLSWSWVGTRITIIRKDDIIFENSIVEPAIGSHPFSFGRNTRNLEYFNSNLIDAVKGENVIHNAELAVKEAEDELENEPEWNLKNIMKRVFIYVIISVMMTVSILALMEQQINPKIKYVPLICIAYIIADISILLKKRKGKKA
ncbi:MAG TPA: hypothetical protein VFG10_05755 [Saprospiraceae bacterium]|nr:hypothetical protein [Saprospiraceae bacterium]